MAAKKEILTPSELGFGSEISGSIKEKLLELQSIQEKLKIAEAAYNAAIKDYVDRQNTLAPEILEIFKEKTENGKKLSLEIDDLMVDITNNFERLDTSYKDAFNLALTKVNEQTKNILNKTLEESKKITRVKGQIIVNKTKVYEGIGDLFGKFTSWLKKSLMTLTNMIYGVRGDIEDARMILQQGTNGDDLMELKTKNKSELRMRAGANGKIFEKSTHITKKQLLEMFDDVMGEMNGNVDLDMNNYNFSFMNEEQFIAETINNRVFEYETVLFGLQSDGDIVHYAARSKEDADNYINTMQKNNREIVSIVQYTNTYEAERHY